MATTKDILYDYAMSFIGQPYIWGGSGVTGWDCSGLVQEILASQGLDPIGDQTAQELYNRLKHREVQKPILMGYILFFGENKEKITHCAFAISQYHMIEAGGGGRATKSPTPGAMVRVRPIGQRSDLVAIIAPAYKTMLS